MATIDLRVKGYTSFIGNWTNLTGTSAQFIDGSLQSNGVAGNETVFDFDDVPANFGSANTLTLKIHARVDGTVNRPKQLVISIVSVAGNVTVGTYTTPNLTSTLTTYTSSAFNISAYTANNINLQFTYIVDVIEGGGMADTATVAFDAFWGTLDYNVAANVTASGSITALNASAFTGTATGSTDVSVSGAINNLLASPLSASFTTSSTAAGLISGLAASSPLASGVGSASGSGLIAGLSARGADGSGYAVNNVAALVGFTDPPGQLLGTQEFRVLVRRSANNPSGTGIPTVNISLYEGGVFRASLVTGVQVTSDIGQLIQVFWDSSLITDPTGFGVQCFVTGTADGTGLNARGVDIGAVEWNSGYQPLAIVKDGGAWKHAVSYLKAGGTWRPAIPKPRDGGSWH